MCLVTRLDPNTGSVCQQWQEVAERSKREKELASALRSIRHQLKQWVSPSPTPLNPPPPTPHL